MQRFSQAGKGARILVCLMLLGLFGLAGCAKTEEETTGFKPATTDGKPLPPEAMKAPAAPGAFDGVGNGMKKR